MRGMLVLLAFLCLPLLYAPVAGAQDAAAAKAHFEKGKELYNAGDYAEALVELRASYEAAPKWKLRYWIGLALVELKDPAGAETELKAYLFEGGGEVPAERKKEVETILAGLSPLLGSPVEKKVEKKVEPVEAPTVTNVVEAALEKPVEKAGTAAKGKKAGLMVKAGGALLGAGLASLVIMAAAGGAALSANSDLEGKCAGGSMRYECGEEHRDEIDRMKSLSTCANVLLALGLAATAAGTALVIVGKKRESKPASQVSISPSLPAGVSLKWSF